MPNLAVRFKCTTFTKLPSNKSHNKSNFEPLDVIGIDILTIKPPHTLKKKVFKSNWNLMVDHAVGFKHSGFYETKSGMVEPTIQQLQRWKREKHRVLTIRCDNAGENKKLEAMCK